MEPCSHSSRPCNWLEEGTEDCWWLLVLHPHRRQDKGDSCSGPQLDQHMLQPPCHHCHSIPPSGSSHPSSYQPVQQCQSMAGGIGRHSHGSYGQCGHFLLLCHYCATLVPTAAGSMALVGTNTTHGGRGRTVWCMLGKGVGEGSGESHNWENTSGASMWASTPSVGQGPWGGGKSKLHKPLSQLS